jgi:hypothetical protein
MENLILNRFLMVSKNRVTVLILICFMSIILNRCSDRHQSDFDKAMVLYYQNKLEEALPEFKKSVSATRNDPRVYAWLAETYRRLGLKKTALSALKIDSCNSHAHTVIADTCHGIPGAQRSDSDTTWIHINKAIACDSGNGNAWMFLCGEAMLRGKYDVMQRSARKLKESGFLTESILAYGHWMISTLPDSAILITNGDMDTFPLLALQTADGFRTDVTVVEKQWLGLKPYLIYLRDYNSVPLPFRETRIDSLYKSMEFPHNMLALADSIFTNWLLWKTSGTFSRPIAIAITVSEDFYSKVNDHLRYSGAYLLWQSDIVNDVTDTLALRKSLSGIQIGNFAGKWVSKWDYSPIRTMYTKELARNITLTALAYAESLIKTQKYTPAEEILNWTERFEKTTETGPVYSDSIAAFRSLIEHKKN